MLKNTLGVESVVEFVDECTVMFSGLREGNCSSGKARTSVSLIGWLIDTFEEILNFKKIR